MSFYNIKDIKSIMKPVLFLVAHHFSGRIDRVSVGLRNRLPPAAR